MKDEVEVGQTMMVEDEEQYMNTKKRKRVVLICILLVLVCSLIIVPISIHYDNLEIAHYVKVDNLVKHLEILEEIALRDNNSRTATTAFNESLVYIRDLLDDFGDYYQIKIQNFTYLDFIELETPVLKIGQRGLMDKVEFRNMRYSGVGNLTNVPVSSVGVGCTSSDWVNFPKDKTHVAVIARNDLIECNVQKKITMAIENEAIAVIMYHIEGSNSLFQMGLSSMAPFPIFAVGHDLGKEIADLEVGQTVSLYSNNTQNLLYTSNLIVETTKGSSYSTIVIGSHLDSVAKGPGINDNGSGSVATLEIALLLAKNEFETKNRLRFIWFGAEELGLLGSKYYVDSLTPLELSKIVMNLNFDMLASPNYIMGIYNGTSHTQQSAEIQLVFEKYFEQNGWPFIPTPFDGRSDYGPFLDKGIPCGGLETGADGIKTVEEFHKFGGVCYVMHDPCYHSKCDTLDNVNRLALVRNTKAAAHAIEFFSGVEGLNQK